MNKSLSATLQTHLESLIARVEQALEAVEFGKITDLGTMETEVAEICQTVEKCDLETARNFKPLMSKMISKLDELAESLSRFQNNIKNRN